MLFLPECFAGSKRILTEGEPLQAPRRKLGWWDGGREQKDYFKTGGGEVGMVHNMQATTHLLLNLSD